MINYIISHFLYLFNQTNNEDFFFSYFVVKYHLQHSKIPVLTEHYGREHDIIKLGPVVDLKPKEEFECTLEEEMIPPIYR